MNKTCRAKRSRARQVDGGFEGRTSLELQCTWILASCSIVSSILTPLVVLLMAGLEASRSSPSCTACGGTHARTRPAARALAYTLMGLFSAPLSE
eukprot:scaffold663808_cov78-Prasinocladus_malaysianus.AAC.1